MGLDDKIKIMSFEQGCFMGASDKRFRQAQKIKNQAMTMANIPISSVKIKHLRIKLIGYYSQPPLCSQVAQRLDVLKYYELPMEYGEPFSKESPAVSVFQKRKHFWQFYIDAVIFWSLGNEFY